MDRGRDPDPRVELTGGEGDEGGGVVPIGGDDQGVGRLDAGQLQHGDAGAVADDGDRPGGPGVGQGGVVQVDDHDLVAGGLTAGRDALDRAPSLGAVADDDDVT